MSFMRSWAGLTRNRFARKAVIFQVANGLASVLQSLAGIVLARVLQPELFGQFSLAFSVASVASVFLAAGIQEALMPAIARAHANNDAGAVLDGYAYWAKWIGISAVSTIVIVALLPMIAVNIYGNSAIGIYAGIILVASFFSSGIFSVAQVSAQVVGKIGMLSWLTLTDMVLRYGAAVILVLAGWKVFGASTGHLVGAVLMMLLAIYVIRSINRKDASIPSLGSIIKRAWQVPISLHFSQSAWVWVDRNFGMLYQALPVAIIGLVVPIAAVSYFKLAFGYVNTGMALLGPISILLNTEFARMQVKESGRLTKNFIRISLTGALVGGVIAGAAAVVGPWLFEFLYGPSYMPSVPLVYGLIVYGALFGLGIGLGPMWRTLGRVRTSVFINILVMVFGLPLGYWMASVCGAWGGVFMVTAWYAVAHLASLTFLLRQLRATKS